MKRIRSIMLVNISFFQLFSSDSLDGISSELS
nr:MAG TPA: hypothetical protein [Caudoviricetes sp.]